MSDDQELRPTSEGRDPGAMEAFWAGDFGTEWIERNSAANSNRVAFWRQLLDQLRPTSVLEVGCGTGANLEACAMSVDAKHLWGVDINNDALAHAKQRVPGAGLGWSSVRSLPFRSGLFDLVISAGVLIHQPDASLPAALGEMVRVSRQWIVFAEYRATDAHVKSYRGHEGVLFKRDYGRVLAELFPELEHVESRPVGADEGFDDAHLDVFRHRIG